LGGGHQAEFLAQLAAAQLRLERDEDGFSSISLFFQALKIKGFA
jgi:hypothetical protein